MTIHEYLTQADRKQIQELLLAAERAYELDIYETGGAEEAFKLISQWRDAHINTVIQ